MSKATFVEQTSVSTPSAGQASVYVRASTKRLASHDDAATVVDYAAVGSGAPVDVDKSAASAGSSGDAARSDHKHDVSTATPVAIGSANAPGSATTLVRSDHVHAHGDQAGGTLHADATTSVDGFMSAADKTKLDGIAAGATVGDADAIHDNVAAEISAVTEKTTPVAADLLLIEDSAAANAKKRVQIGNLPGGALPTEYVQGLSYARTAARVVTVQPGKARNIDDTDDIVLSASDTCDLDVSGAGGLDTGSVAANTWYSLWLIGDAGTASVDLLFSTSSTEAGLTYPGSFDVARRIGWCRTDASSNIYVFSLELEVGQRRYVDWGSNQERNTVRVLDNGTATTFTTVDLDDWVPPTCELGRITARFHGEDDNQRAVFRPNGSSLTDPPYFVESNDGGGGQAVGSSIFDMPLNSSQQLQYSIEGAAGGARELSLYVLGFNDQLLD